MRGVDEVEVRTLEGEGVSKTSQRGRERSKFVNIERTYFLDDSKQHSTILIRFHFCRNPRQILLFGFGHNLLQIYCIKKFIVVKLLVI